MTWFSRKMKVVEFCLISILLVLFLYQSSKTIMKYQAKKNKFAGIQKRFPDLKYE